MDAQKTFFAALGKILGIIIILFAEYLVSWAGVCFVLWVIAKLLHITYSFRVASGIWLAMIFVQKFIESIMEKYK